MESADLPIPNPPPDSAPEVIVNDRTRVYHTGRNGAVLCGARFAGKRTQPLRVVLNDQRYHECRRCKAMRME